MEAIMENYSVYPEMLKLTKYEIEKLFKRA